MNRFVPALRFLSLVAAVFFCSQAFGDVIISEFVGSNQTGLVDEDGDTSDWLELYNNGPVSVNLLGWSLTDDTGSPTKWSIPGITLEPKGFLVIFCSGKNRTTLNQPLHTNFKISAGGGYLGLRRPDGSVASEFNPYPAQYQDKPYGIQQTVATTSYVTSTSSLKYFVPTNNSLGLSWTAPGFNDASWSSGTNGLGYESTVPGWLFKTWFSNTSTLSTLAAANGVINTPSQQTAFYQQTLAVVNYNDQNGQGHYASDLNPPWLGGSEHDNFVVEATGILTVPAAGTYTFGVNSDDGFELKVRTVGSPTPWSSVAAICSYNGGRPAADTLGSYTFPTAGDYEIRVMIFQGVGGAGGELFSTTSPGSAKSSWDSTFRLVGDTVNSGLAVRSIPVSTAGSFTNYIRTNVQTAMQNVSPAIYVRYGFNAPSPASVTTLSLPVRYDGGFVAYLNGTEVARRNVPAGNPSNTTTASGLRSKTLAGMYETIDLTPWLNLLQTGSNVLAIAGANASINSSDFLLQPEVDSYLVTAGPVGYFVSPTPAAFNTTAPYNKVAPVIASIGRGFYTTPQSVTLSCGTTGATIRYTVDGSSPYQLDVDGNVVKDTGGNPIASATSGVYTAPLTISSTTTLRYGALKSGYDPSDSVTQTYVFLSDVVTQEPTGAPPSIQNPSGASPASTVWPVDSADSGGLGYRLHNQFLNFGMDPNVVNVSPYNGQINGALQAIPSFSIVTDLPFLMDPNIGIYVNAEDDSIQWERPASLELIYPDGTAGFQVNCGIRIRGGYSRSPDNPKHAWRIFFRDAYGTSSLSYPFFGTGIGAQSFSKFDIRNAQNYSWSFDPGDGTQDTYVKDEFCRDIQLAMGDASSHGGFYQLYVNGQYWGLTNFDERPEANFGSTYFGGNPDDFDTIKVSPDQNYEIGATDGTLGLPVSGDPNDPQQLGSGWYRFWNRADQGLSTSNSVTQNNSVYQELLGNNPDGTRNVNYPVLLDSVNLSDYMLCIMYSGNQDAAISSFLNNQRPNNWFGIRDRTGASGGWKFVLHDSEHTFMNASDDRFGPWPAGNSSQASAVSGVSQFYFSSPQYIWQQLLNSPEYKLAFADRVQKHCYNNGACTPARALAMFNARTAAIDSAIIGESARWGDSKRTPALTRADWLNACNFVRNSVLPVRTANLIAQFRQHGIFPGIDTAVFSQRGGTVLPGYSLTLSNPNASTSGQTIYYTTDGTDPRAYGGGIGATAQVYSGPITVSLSKTIRVRIKSTTEWSALDEATFYTSQDYTGLVISEINYNPLPNGSTSGDQFEFLEFKNTSGHSMDLGGLTFTSGLTYTFPTGASIAPGGFYVIGRSQSVFNTRYPGVTLNGIYTGKLSNGGDTITLSTSTGGVIIALTYGDRAPWPAAPDGSGYTLVLSNPNSNPDLNNPANWRASTNVGGSPGADDPTPPTTPQVVVNEAVTNSVSPLTDTIELYNPGTTAADISNWWLSDDHNTPQKYRIPAGTIIPAGGYVTFNESQFNPTPGAGTSFALDGNGEEVYLFAGNASGGITGYSHGFAFLAAEPNVSFGRYVNSVGTESFPRQKSNTFGAANAGPLVGPVVLNELQYEPPAGYDEFVEIKNISNATVQLYDPANPANTWKVDGIGFTFPQNSSLPAGALALIVPIDPQSFRNKYNVPAQVRIFGPYTGVLSDKGEPISLEMPAPPDTTKTPPTVSYIVIDSVSYLPNAPWPAGAAGSGPSLQRRDATAYGDDPANWYATGITPGLENGVNAPPVVALTSPANNASVTLPASIVLVATASDPDGSIVKVQFYDGSTQLGESVSSPYTFTWSGASPGVHTLTGRAIDSGLAVTTSSPVTLTVNPPAIGNGAGLHADYFNNTSLTPPVIATRVDGPIDLFNSYQPPAVVPTTNMSVRWTGQILPRYSTTYNFYTNSDDGVRLTINGQSVITNWTNHGPTTDVGTATLNAGQLYDITLEYFQGTGGAICQLYWEANQVGLTKQLVPASQLFPAQAAPIIITPPASQTVEQGSNVGFSVFASGTGLSYSWLKGGQPISGATSQSLVLSEVLPSDAGSYSVKVTDGYGSTTSTAATLTVTFTDTDSDGIQDAWLQKYFGHPTGMASDHSRASDDADGDGRTNLQEYLAGTNPLDPTSRFDVSVTADTVYGGYIVSFTANSQRSYTIQYKNALSDTQWQKLQDVPPAVGKRTVSVSDGTRATGRFYRVVTPSQ